MLLFGRGDLLRAPVQEVLVLLLYVSSLVPPYHSFTILKTTCNLHHATQATSSAGDYYARSATHDTSRTSFHVKHIGQFAQTLENVSLCCSS
jgi:hypothetical protein